VKKRANKKDTNREVLLVKKILASKVSWKKVVASEGDVSKKAKSEGT